MTRRWGIAGGSALIVFCLLLVAGGGHLVHKASAMPEYVNEDRAREVLLRACHLNANEGSASKEEEAACTREWFQDIASFRTSKWVLHDTGYGLIALSASFLASIAWFRLWDVRRLRDVGTPWGTFSFLSLCTAAWLLEIPAYVFHLVQRAKRGYFPWWADSLGIPIFTATAGLLMLLPFLLALVWVAVLWRARLPANLWTTDPSRRWAGRFWAVVFGIIIMLILWSLADVFVRGDFLRVPLLAIWLYLALSARAAAVSRG